MTESELVLTRIKEIKALGHGSVTIKIRDGKVQLVETTRQEQVK